jgi:hypothetical protein
MARIYSKSANCEACGLEYLTPELHTVKIASFKRDLTLCNACLNSNTFEDYIYVSAALSDPLQKYREVIKILNKRAQQEPVDAELASPQVRIEPQETLIDKAVQKLKQMQPNYFVGVRKIVSGPEANYGHVESGKGKDPTVIHINFPRIKSEVEKELAGSAKEDIDDAIINNIVSVLAHEAGHVKSYDPEKGFVGAETPALAEEQKIHNQNK